MARPTVYKGADGWWHSYVTVGRKPDGKLDRRHIRAKTRASTIEKVDELEDQLRGGHVPQAGSTETLATWLEHWLTTIAARRCRRSTLDGYESKIRHRIAPALGHHRLKRLTAEHVEAWLAELEDEVKPATALQCFRILSRALKVAAQRKRIPRNPCELVDPPGVSRAECIPFDADEVGQILAAAAARRERVRWWVALGLGLRQGEALGLMWPHVDLERATLTVAWELIRIKWRHGCDDPARCVQTRHGCDDRGRCGEVCPKPRTACRTAACRPGCRRHKRACPAPCSPGCTDHQSTCPRRVKGGLVLDEPKSRKSKRTLPLPPVLVELLREHRQAQRAERLAAGPLWEQPFDAPLVFAQPNGRPVNPRADWGQWKALLAEAGVRDDRLHAARHTFASLTIDDGANVKVVQEWLGHAQASLTQDTYAHVFAKRMRVSADQLGVTLERFRQPTQPKHRGQRGA